MPDRGYVRYVADENAMGLAKFLIRDHAREDVLYPGHPLLPEVPRGSNDLDWMPLVGRMHWIALTRDRRIRTRPAELAVYREHGVRSVWIGGKQDHSPAALAPMFIRHERRLDQLATKLSAGPWALTMTPSGVRELRVRSL